MCAWEWHWSLKDSGAGEEGGCKIGGLKSNFPSLKA